MFIDEILALKAVEGQAGVEEGAGREAHREWRDYNQETLLQ